MPRLPAVVLVVFFDDGFGHVAGTALVFDFTLAGDDMGCVLVLFVDFDTQCRCVPILVVTGVNGCRV